MKKETTIAKDEIITNKDGCNLNLSLYARVLEARGESKSDIKEKVESIKKETI